MDANTLFFDTTYIVRLYLQDHGFDRVRVLADQFPKIMSSWHARSEFFAASHRAYREGRLNHKSYLILTEQFASDCHSGLFEFLPLIDGVEQLLEKTFISASAKIFIRAADAMHLACAAHYGFKEIYSDDRHLLAAAQAFGIYGVNII